MSAESSLSSGKPRVSDAVPACEPDRVPSGDHRAAPDVQRPGPPFRRRGHDLRCSLNLSGYVFNDSKLIGFIDEQLKEHGPDPSAIVLEITEQVAVQHLGQVCGLNEETLAMLRGLGVEYAQGYHLGKPAAALIHETQTLNDNNAEEIGWQEFQNDVAQLCINWYLHDKPSFRSLAVLLLERGVPACDHKALGTPHGLRSGESPQAAAAVSNPAYRVAECSVKLEGRRKYLYRAIDCEGTMLDFVLCDTPAREAAALFSATMYPGRNSRQAAGQYHAYKRVEHVPPGHT